MLNYGMQLIKGWEKSKDQDAIDNLQLWAD